MKPTQVSSQPCPRRRRPGGPASLDEVRDGLAERAATSPSEAAALVSFLAYKLGKPVLVEGPAGVGKTELAKALSR